MSHGGMAQPVLVVMFSDGGRLSLEFVADGPGDDEPRLGSSLEPRASAPRLTCWIGPSRPDSPESSVAASLLLQAAWRPGIHYCADRVRAILAYLANANRNPRCRIYDAIALTS